MMPKKIDVFIYLHGYTIVENTQFICQENLQEESQLSK